MPSRTIVLNGQTASVSVPDESQQLLYKSRIVARKGRFHVSGRGCGGDVSYEKLLRDAALVLTSNENATVVAPADYRVVGQSMPRVDIPPKMTADFRFVHDIVLPGMLHGRLVRPPGRNSTNPVISNLARAEAIPGFRYELANAYAAIDAL